MIFPFTALKIKLSDLWMAGLFSAVLLLIAFPLIPAIVAGTGIDISYPISLPLIGICVFIILLLFNRYFGLDGEDEERRT